MPSCFTVSGRENERQNFAATRSVWRYSMPSAGFSDFLSPLRTRAPSLTSTLMSSFFIPGSQRRDRKSTRLNSSHLGISYAVFCLKKKKRHLPHRARLVATCTDTSNDEAHTV